MTKCLHYDIDLTIYKRFEQKNDMFCRYLWDKSLNTYRHDFSKKMMHHISKAEAGFSHFDYAFSKASWAVYNRYPFAFTWNGDVSFEEDWYGYKIRKEKYEINDPKIFTDQVKKVAKFYGATLVGIADLDDKWIYKTAGKRFNGKFIGDYP